MCGISEHIRAHIGEEFVRRLLDLEAALSIGTMFVLAPAALAQQDLCDCSNFTIKRMRKLFMIRTQVTPTV